uniref:Uncharacterized protein n=1 Tax=Nelumbo nucifera TaxID=4432 RepID=A0A822YQK7_NELNU|nr:TPA_asm: hypothetical protein HUJ06_005480 [Nelumbo nucifera]
MPVSIRTHKVWIPYVYNSDVLSTIDWSSIPWLMRPDLVPINNNNSNEHCKHTPALINYNEMFFVIG